MSLPPEMISDVLCRLPVKSLLRFRCTSKRVCSIISSPDFTELHLHRSAQTNSNQSLVLTNCPLFSVDLPSLERAVKIQHPLKTVQGNTDVIGSCNGLLCLYNSEAEIVLWNISTGKHHRLPYIPVVFPQKSSAADKRAHRVAYGFGYDSVHHDYKLVRIVRFRNTLDSEVRVYSLKSNWWKRICGFPYDLLYPQSVGVLAEGALHWLINHPIQEEICLIVAFDPAIEAFREVPMPPDASCIEPFVQLAALESRLCVIHNIVGKNTDMWMLNESWAKLISTSKPLITSSCCCIIPVASLSNGNGLLLLKDYKKFLRFDLKRNVVKNVKIDGLPTLFDVLPYVESLVEPLPIANGDDATAGKQKGRRGKKNVGKW